MANKKLKLRYYIGFFVALFAMNLVVVPAYFYNVIEIPPDGDLIIAEGKVLLKGTKRGGSVIYLTNNGKNTLYTCSKDQMGGGSNCGSHIPIDFDELEKTGTNIQIKWFEQPVTLTHADKRIVSLSVEGKEYLSREDTLKRIEKGKRSSVWAAIVALLFMLYMLYAFLKPAPPENIEEIK